MSFLYNQNHVELCYGLFFSLANSPGVRLLFRQLAMLHCNIPLCKPQINTYLSVLGNPCANSTASMVKIVFAKSRHASTSFVESMTPSIE